MGWVIVTYRRVHWCSNVANRAEVRLMARLKNHREFTQTAYSGGEKAGGVTTKGGGFDVSYAFGLARR